MKEFAEKEPERVIARSVLDGVSEWWNGSSQTAERAPRPEQGYTKQDWEQSLALVAQPLVLSVNELRTGKLDRFKCTAAANRLPGAISALQTMAAAKKEVANQQNLLTPVADIQAAHTSLLVLGDWMAAPAIWKDAFMSARKAVDTALNAPVIDPDSAKDAPNADPPPADGLMKADRDKIVETVIPLMEMLITKTAAQPFQDWDPVEYVEADNVLAALGGLSHVRSLEPARAAVEKGKQAITAFTGDIQKTLDDAIAKLESAQVKLSVSAQGYLEASTPPQP